MVLHRLIHFIYLTNRLSFNKVYKMKMLRERPFHPPKIKFTINGNFLPFLKDCTLKQINHNTLA